MFQYTTIFRHMMDYTYTNEYRLMSMGKCRTNAHLGVLVEININKLNRITYKLNRVSYSVEFNVNMTFVNKPVN